MVSTLDSESSDPGSNPGRTSFSIFAPLRNTSHNLVEGVADGCVARCTNWSYGVMVSTLDFESSDPGSSPGRTLFLRLFPSLFCLVGRV